MHAHKLILLLAVVAACAGDKDDPGTDTTPPADTDTDTAPTGDTGWTGDTGTPLVDPLITSIPAIQTGGVAQGTLVEVEGVVTATDTYGFFVQDVIGGAYSGIWVYGGEDWEADLGYVTRGDDVRLVGIADEYEDRTEIDLLADAQGTIERLGSGAAPAPELVDIDDLQFVNAEPWEGVLVAVQGLTVEDAALGYGQALLGSGGQSMVIDDTLHSWAGVPDAPLGFPVSEVAGPVDYTFGSYKVLPRDAADIVSTATTIQAVQLGEVEEDAEVTVFDAVVTGVDDVGVFVQDDAGGAWSGVWVFLGSYWQGSWGNLAVGDRVDVTGVYEEYFGLTEVNVTTSSSPLVVRRGAGTPLEPEVLAVSAVGEAWEGVLVEVQDVEVSDPRPGNDEFVVEPAVGGGGEYVYVDNALHLYSGFAALAAGDDFLSVVGPLNYSFGEFKIAPRSDDDLSPGVVDTNDTGLVGPPLATIYEVQQEAFAQGTDLEVSGVVTATGPYGLYLQDEAGGAYSGIFVYLGSNWETTWGTYVEGDLLSVAGTYTEYFEASEIDVAGSPVARIELDGSASVPAPEVLAVDAIDEEWEGVLVEIGAVNVSDPNHGPGSFEVIDLATSATVVVNDDLHTWSQLGSLSQGDALSYVRGPLDHQNGGYEILPRRDSDLP